ncbi:MAG: transposase, partial [Elainellaceae cyanobacterium]
YQRGVQGFLDWVCYLYVLGLSIRDLQVLLYWQLGHVLSCNAINQVRLEEAQQRCHSFIETWGELEPDAIHAFQWGLERTFSSYQLEASWHRFIRTTNALERLFREFRTKADEIGAFPNEQSCLTLFSLVIQLDHAKHNRKSDNYSSWVHKKAAP